MIEMKDLHKKFCVEGYDENNILNKFELRHEDNFNFAYDVIDVIAENEPERRAMVWINDKGEEHIFNYSDLSKKSNQVANMFLAHGIKKGDKVLCVLKRHYQFWFVVMALEKIGAIIVPATNQLMVKDYVYRFNAAGIKYCVVTSDDDVSSRVEEAIGEYNGIEEKFIVRGNKENWVSFDEEYLKYPETLDRIQNDCNDDLLLYFTSGTTGFPKMVVHNHTYAIAHILTAKHWHNIKDDTLHFTISETGWAKCMWGKMYGQFFLAASIFVYDFEKFNADDILTKMQQYNVSSFCAPPTMYRFFIKEGMEKYDLSALKYSTVAGEALNPEVFNRWFDYTGLKLMEGFGQTECVIMVANMPGMNPKPGSMGKPMPLFNIDIVDDDNNTVAVGEVGEIVIRTDGRQKEGLLKCYYNNEEATNEVWHDNVYHTGDTAWRDEEGYYWYVSRKDDVIKASGYRIGPFEIESVLMEHPAVLEVAVTGAQDPIRGQVVKATIVLTKTYKDKGDENLVKELQNYVKHATAPYKYPRIIEFVDELPKTISGKIRRNVIRQNDNQ